MKYFVKQVRAVRIDEFQFRKGLTFEMSHEVAKDLYWKHALENQKPTELGNELFERGQFVNLHPLGLVFYGEDCTDAELFKDRLNGKIAKEVWE